MQLPSCTTSTCLSPLPRLPPPSIAASGGIGYGPGSDSLRYAVNLIGTFGCPEPTTSYGMP